MIRLGCSMAEIAAEIMREDRRKTEPVWEFETRLMPKSRHTQQPFSGLKAFVEKGQ
jgi:hypothetical protein